MDRELEDFIKNAKDDLYYKLPGFNLSVSGKKERIVTGIDVRIGHLLYQVCLMENTSYHYDFKLSSERDTLRTL